ncbi:hypothetical protein FHW83_003269 [Duganella sp. SG902]|nr:hypothetical protein [Duganella sp. SG902]
MSVPLPVGANARTKDQIRLQHSIRQGQPSRDTGVHHSISGRAKEIDERTAIDHRAGDNSAVPTQQLLYHIWPIFRSKHPAEVRLEIATRRSTPENRKYPRRHRGGPDFEYESQHEHTSDSYQKACCAAMYNDQVPRGYRQPLPRRRAVVKLGRANSKCIAPTNPDSNTAVAGGTGEGREIRTRNQHNGEQCPPSKGISRSAI